MSCLEKICKWLRDPVHFILIVAVCVFLLIISVKMDINNFLMSTASAFFGAGAAFLFNVYSNNSNEKRRNIATLIKTKYTIEKIALMRKQLECHISKYSNLKNDDFFEWEKIPEYDPSSYFPEIEVKDLLFLLECNKKGEEILNSILLVYAENSEVVNVLKERNEMYIFYLNKTENRESIQKNQLEKIVGLRLFKRLELYTQRLIDANNHLLEDCDKAKNNINNFITEY